MVNPGEHVSITLKREFGEEAMNSMELTEQETVTMTRQISDLFATGNEVTWVVWAWCILLALTTTY